MLDRVKALIEKGNTIPKFIALVIYHVPKITDQELGLINKACAVTGHVFRDDIRHSTKEAYITHLLAVAVIIVSYLGMRDVNLIIAAILHDLIEDKPYWTYESLVQEFNVNVADLVYSVTKLDRQPGESEHNYQLRYFAQVWAGGIRSVILKLADRLHNMLTLWGPPEKKRAKTLETLQYVLPLAVQYQILWPELTLACAEQIRESNRVAI
ncbi:MAG TPA: HD domain-containing protein [Candidatus Paceibacterota bacterium]|nr:HD domain-containing protein [Candidatus Paceibacterota bacterium]HMO83247.1 HD domain-containing protein [Candidatus Paceibacterota bacterium]